MVSKSESSYGRASVHKYCINYHILRQKNGWHSKADKLHVTVVRKNTEFMYNLHGSAYCSYPLLTNWQPQMVS